MCKYKKRIIKVKEITRQQTWDAFEANHCPRCNKVVDMERIPTHMPGIQCKKCLECSGFFQANFLDDADDIITCPVDFTFIT
jgi:hypothetical protein